MNQTTPPPPQNPTPPPKRRSACLPFLLIGFFVAVLAALVGIILIILSMRSSKPVSVTRNSVLRIRLSGLIKEYTPPSPFEFLLDSRSLELHDYIHMINRAKHDAKIVGVWLEIGNTNLGWAQLDGLRRSLSELKQAGKWIIASGELWQEREYFLASVADEVYMSPESIILLDGLMSRTTFYADLLKKYGVGVHVEAIGKYKSYGDAYQRSQMSEFHRESTRALLDAIETAFLEAVGAGRNIEMEALRTMLRNTVYDPHEAMELGLLDGTRYNDEIRDEIAERLGTPVGRLRLVEGSRLIQPRGGSGFASDQIAVIYALGAIQSGNGVSGLFGETVLGADSFIEDLLAARENPKVKAIVIRIDSPGGSALASDIMWREIRRTSEMGIPVIASMGSVAASGGYYIAMACQEIVALPTTITGSIGVVTMRLDLEGFYQKFLVNVGVVKTAPSADFFDPHRALTRAEIEGLHQRTTLSYKSFVAKVAESRNMSYEDVEPWAQGRVWSGADALEHHLVDHFGNLEYAIQLAARRAEISNYGIIRFPLEEDYWEMLQRGRLTRAGEQAAFRKWLPEELRFLHSLVAGPDEPDVHLLAIAPFHVRIN